MEDTNEQNGGYPPQWRTAVRYEWINPLYLFKRIEPPMHGSQKNGIFHSVSDSPRLAERKKEEFCVTMLFI